MARIRKDLLNDMTLQCVTYHVEATLGVIHGLDGAMSFYACPRCLRVGPVELAGQHVVVGKLVWGRLECADCGTKWSVAIREGGVRVYQGGCGIGKFNGLTREIDCGEAP